MNISAALKHGTDALAASSSTASLDAELLLAHVLSATESSWLHARPEVQLTPSEQTAWDDLLSKRASGAPVAYLIGNAVFYGRSFLVTPEVLIPRPETEDLVDQALAVIDQLPMDSPVVADVGTGSGCIAITLALANPNIQLFATDVSLPALAIAKQNAEAHGVADRITFLHGDMLTPFDANDRKPSLDLIVSNPPYVPSAEIDTARQRPEATGLAFEPRLALDGSGDGQLFVNKLQTAGIPAVIETTNGAIVRQHC